MGSLEKRLEALEESYRTSEAGQRAATATREREELRRKVWSSTLNAVAWIRRAPVDSPQWGYEVGKLRDESPFAIATHVAALATLEHPDEDEARRILAEVEAERGIEDSPLWEMIESVVAAMDRMREPHGVLGAE
jgi:hypothetical protein